jgi:ABC-type bacteriocin/lantibiotic exporter with double-glycine peptidase domain
MTAQQSTRGKFLTLYKLWPDIKAIMLPRCGLLAAGLVLVGFRSAAALVIPLSIKILVDRVVGQNQTGLLLPLIGLVLCATAIQGGADRKSVV